MFAAVHASQHKTAHQQIKLFSYWSSVMCFYSYDILQYFTAANQLGHSDVDAMHANPHAQLWPEHSQESRLWQTSGAPSIRRILANAKQQHELLDPYSRHAADSTVQQFME